MKPGQGQSQDEVISETIKGLNPFFLMALIICNGNFQLLPESYWSEMKVRCPSEYLDDRPKPLGKNSNWGASRPQNEEVVYNRCLSLPKMQEIVVVTPKIFCHWNILARPKI